MKKSTLVRSSKAVFLAESGLQSNIVAEMYFIKILPRRPLRENMECEVCGFYKKYCITEAHSILIRVSFLSR